MAGKIQSAQRASIAPVEWSYVEVLDPNTEIGRVSLELPKMELKYQKSEHGPARPNSSRSVSLTVGDAGTQIVEEKIGAYLAVYAVTLERGFLRAEIIYDDKNVYVAGFHK